MAPSRRPGARKRATDGAPGLDAARRDLDPQPAAAADAARQAEIARLAAEIDLEDAGSILFFGAQAQRELTRLADAMLEGVRATPAGTVGGTLGRMVTKLRELDLAPAEARPRAIGLLRRMLGGQAGAGSFAQRYDRLREQVDALTGELEGHKATLLGDLVRLNRLYDANLDYFRLLDLYIAAGRARLEELDTVLLPRLRAEAAARDDVLAAQRLRDLGGSRDDLDRRLHDLLLTRQVTVQALPSIRLIQENDKALVRKIDSMLVNTLPLWRQQLAQALTILRMGEAAGAVRAAADLTNELLTTKAAELRRANASVREEIERGVVDFASVREANEALTAAIGESLAIADAGRQQRRTAADRLAGLEAELRDRLAAAPPAG